ncbi:type VI secretion system baseplate subunit TssK [Vibrio sp. S4M6]|uniref:type VI secretion system baseplate subunit TssK n=1 Tax=Vibrio sinus TaxID=2946865 RepID=UPI00202A1F42|nr:type VI secretion system baseplate subunit TssK [Vibrio sinus]MCL9780076.1 type VI secretion system baseplate subunit TssK [Vibrio sinus]
MSMYNPVVWQDGMFMRPQHFQQLERSQKKSASLFHIFSSPLHWGIKHLEVNNELLALGKIGLTKAEGIFLDRTPFELPLLADLPKVLEVPTSTVNKVVFLCCPLPSDKSQLFGSDSEHSRYSIHTQEACDACYDSVGVANIEVGKLNFKLLIEDEDKCSYTGIPILKISEVSPEGKVVLDADFIPPCVDIQASPVLSHFASEFASMLQHKAESIVRRLGEVDQQGVSSVADFMLLQILNRYEPLFWHLSKVQGVHPANFYQILLQAEGELSTLCSANRRPRAFVQYVHQEATQCFSAYLRDLKSLLSVMSEQRAIPLAIKEQQFGIKSADIPDRKLVENMTFVLAVKADVSVDILHTQFVSQTKLGAIDHIRDLINLQLPGIRLKAMPVVPRALPYHAGYTYFELDKGSEEWASFRSSAALAIHTAGEFKGLSLQLWAVKL